MVHIQLQGVLRSLEFFSASFGLLLLQFLYLSSMCMYSCIRLNFHFPLTCIQFISIVNSLFLRLWIHCRKALQEQNQADSFVYRLYVIVIVIYAGFQFFLSMLMRIPACHRMTNQCDRWPLIRFLKWMRQVLFIFDFRAFLLPTSLLSNSWQFALSAWFAFLFLQERYYVGRGMYERTSDFFK